MKKGYHGVYGKNSGGIFTNWDNVQIAQLETVGFKNKKFRNAIEALGYVVDRIIEDYKVIWRDNLNEDKILNNIGKFFEIKDLMLDKRKRKHSSKNYWGVSI